MRPVYIHLLNASKKERDREVRTRFGLQRPQQVGRGTILWNSGIPPWMFQSEISPSLAATILPKLRHTKALILSEAAGTTIIYQLPQIKFDLFNNSFINRCLFPYI